MNETVPTNAIASIRGRKDIIAGLLITIVGVTLALTKTAYILVKVFFVIVGVVAYIYGYQYLPLAVLLQLAFSVEIQVTATTRLTVPSEILIPILFFTFAIGAIHDRKLTYRPSPLNVAVVLMYFVMVFSLTRTTFPVSTIKALIRDTGYIITGYYLIPKYVNSEKRLWHVVMGCLILHTVLVLYGLLTQVMGGIRIYDRIASPFFIEHCIYAAFITMTFAFLLAYFLDLEAGPTRKTIGIITALFGLAIVLTFVRASWISVIFLSLYYMYHFRHKKSAVDLLLIIIVLILLGLAVLAFTDLGTLLMQRFETVFDFQYVANYDRLDRWIAAWQIWTVHPWFGVGWGAYPDVYFGYITYSNAYSASLRMGAHNLYLEIMAETGLFGIIAFLAMIYTFFHQSVSLQHSVYSSFQRVFIIGLQGAMVTYLIHAFLNNLGPSDKISLSFWFMLGMIPTLTALSKLKANGDTPPQEPLENAAGK